MKGANVASITSIGGIATSTIPGWPTGATCETVYYGYVNGNKNQPKYACILEQFPYEWDGVTGILYNEGGCGTSPAETGYYSDGINISYWDGGSFTDYGPCK
jgi:hypothetical protein